MSAVPVSMAVLIRTFSSGIHTHPVSWNCAYHLRMLLSDGGCFPNLVRNCRWTIVPRQSFWLTLYLTYMPSLALVTLPRLSSWLSSRHPLPPNFTMQLWQTHCLAFISSITTKEYASSCFTFLRTDTYENDDWVLNRNFQRQICVFLLKQT